MKNHHELVAAAKGMLTRDEPALHVVPPASEPEGETTQPMAVVPAAPAPLAGRQMGFLDQMRAQAGHTRMQARQARHLEGGVFHRLYHGQPKSLAQHAEYRQSRRWVKPGHRGGVADKGGAAFHKTIAPPLKVIGLAFSEAGDSPLKTGIAYYAGVLPLTCLALWGFGDLTLAVWIAVINVAIIVAIVLTLCAVTRPRDEAPVAEVVTEDEEPTP